VEGVGELAAAVDVGHDVGLADGRPVVPVAAVGGTRRAEARPVAEAIGAAHVRLLDHGRELDLLARVGGEVSSLGGDATRGPVARAVLDGLDDEVAAAVEVQVGREALSVSTSAVPQLAAPPGYEVPV